MSNEGQTVTIIVNGTAKQVPKKDSLAFQEVVALADGLPVGPNIEYTITYRRGHGDKPEGSLVPGQDVKVKEGMIFNVTATDRS